MELQKSNWERKNAKSRGKWFAHAIPNTIGFNNHFKLYNDIVFWIRDNLRHHTQDARWIKIGDCIYVQFKNEKDYVWFMMRWA